MFKISRSEDGQVIVESVLLLLIGTLLVVSLLQMSIMLTWRHYIQYASFMAAREYFLGAGTPQESVASAKSLLGRYLSSDGGNSLASIMSGLVTVELDESKIGPDQLLYSTKQGRGLGPGPYAEGVQVIVKSKIPFLDRFLKIGSPSQNVGATTTENRTESFLRREPSRQECTCLMANEGCGSSNSNSSIKLGGKRDPAPWNTKVWLEDNGC